VRADAAIVTEPTGAEMTVAIAHKGFTWHEIVVRGRAAHGSRPEDGVDAIARMGPVLVELDRFAAELIGRSGHPLLGPGSIHASIIDGGRSSTYPESCRLQLSGARSPARRQIVEAEPPPSLATPTPRCTPRCTRAVCRLPRTLRS
jgi:acetylornithine deacetylase